MKKIIQLLILPLLFVSCKSETETMVDSTTKLYDNGKYIEVLKTNKKTKHIGFITNINYGISYRFNYSFTVNGREVIWSPKGSAEPKNIIFAKDSIYLQSLEKRSFPFQEVLTDTVITSHKDSIVSKYEVYIDNRYFFNLFGDDFWLNIPSEQYAGVVRNNKVFAIPNDNEYQLEE